jgi:hypothetical protein
MTEHKRFIVECSRPLCEGVLRLFVDTKGAAVLEARRRGWTGDATAIHCPTHAAKEQPA